MADDGPDDWAAPATTQSGADDWVAPSGGVPANGNSPGSNGGESSGSQSGAGVPTPAPSKPWGDVASEAVGNIIPSAVATAKAIIQPLRHPLDTAGALYNAATGEEQKLAGALGLNPPLARPEAARAADALNSYFANRYGSIEGFKRAVAKDPVGVMTDASVLLGGTGAAAEKGTELIAKAGDIANTASRVANPVSAIGNTVGAVAKPLANAAAEVVGNFGTHTGALPLKLAAQAGYGGGDAAQAFLDNMRGNAPIESVVGSAKAALGQMRAARGAAYRSGMADVSNDATVLDFGPIDSALEKTNDINSFKGQDLSPNTTVVREEVNAAVNGWKLLDPATYHTPEGFDALKKKIGDIKDAQPFGTPQRTIASNAYNAVRQTIADQAPAYSNVMSDYENASNTIDSLQRELSLGPKGNPGTALRKLQSIMRNNVNTGYGNREQMMGQLSDAGATTLPYELAGQSLNKLTPRGLGTVEAAGTALAALAGHPYIAAALPFMSPRLVGEAAYGAGALGRKLAPIARPVAEAAPGATQIGYEAAAPMLTDASADQQPAPLAYSTAALMHIASPQGYADGGRIHAAASEADTEPTDAQIEANNYKHGHFSLHGFRFSIETPKGVARRGFGSDGKMWENRHDSAHYGYLRGFGDTAADDEKHDAYVGPHLDGKRIFVVNQIDPKTKKFDETKIIFGARTLTEARKIYDGGFSDGSGPKRRWAVHETDPETLKKWLAGSRAHKPFPSAVSA